MPDLTKSFSRPEVHLARPRNPRAAIPVLPTDRIVKSALTNRQYAVRALRSIQEHNSTKRPLALIIAAYNEELVLERTIRSAIAAGLKPQDIYVVDDSSADRTASIACRVVGDYNVLTVGRSGKGLALHTLVDDLRLTKRYDWIHIADADGEFDRDYFHELYSNLKPTYAAATGYVASLPGSYISKYRAFEYAVGMDVTRRFQALSNLITIIPGPTSVFRSDIFEQLDFKGKVLCEDFDVTLQIHRQNLGSIQFIPTAIARTQDPGTFQDFVKQVTRWNRGVMQMFVKHRVGLRLNKVDAYLWYQLSQNITFAAVNLLFIPILTILTGNPAFIALGFLSDVAVVMAFTLFAMARTGRKDIIESFPLNYTLRWIQIGIFIKCFVEVFILGKFRIQTRGGWERVARRANA